MVLDTTGVDLMPFVRPAGHNYAIPEVAILAMLKAESGLNPNAWREGIWPDVSGGLSQITVATARGYGIGDGQDTPENRAVVRAALTDRATSIDLGARHLAGNLAYVMRLMPFVKGDAWIILGLRVYNGGTYGLDPDYERKYPGNLASYRAALRWAHEALGQ